MPSRLHIKICEARDVLKMDTVGKSDPYVTIRLKSQDKKERVKTQIISNTDHPIWNQEFDIVAADPNDVLLIDMYDEDNNIDEKMMDELQFPVSTWPVGGQIDRKEIDIKLKKKNAGKLIFEVQSFPAEGYASSNRAVVLDGSSGGTNGCKLHIKAFNAKNVLKMDTVGKSDPYLRFRLKGKKESTVKTQIISNTKNPVWNQELDVVSHDRDADVLQVDMLDEDIKNDDKMMDRIEIPLRDHQIGEHYVFNEGVRLKKKDAGKLHFEINFLPENGVGPNNTDYNNGVVVQSNAQGAKTRDVQLNSQAPSNGRPCRLVVQAIKAENLRKLDKPANPYATFNLKGHPETMKRTRAIDNDLNPTWNQEFEYKCNDWNSDSLVVNLYNQGDKEKMMNEIELPLHKWPIGTHIDYQEEIKLNKKNAGRLFLGIDVLDPEIEDPVVKSVEPAPVPQKEESEPEPEHETEPETETETYSQVQSRDLKLDDPECDYCNFSLGNFTSCYSTDFVGYSEYTRSLSDFGSEERRFHRHHRINNDLLEDEIKEEKAVRAAESIKGTIVKCDGLPGFDDGSDLYAVVSCITKSKRDKKGEKVETESQHASKNPIWNKDFDFEKAKKGDSLKVDVFKVNKALGDQVIASVDIPLVDLKENEPIEKDFKLEKPRFAPKIVKKVKDFGTVTISLTHTVQYE